VLDTTSLTRYQPMICAYRRPRYLHCCRGSATSTKSARSILFCLTLGAKALVPSNHRSVGKNAIYIDAEEIFPQQIWGPCYKRIYSCRAFACFVTNDIILGMREQPGHARLDLAILHRSLTPMMR